MISMVFSKSKELNQTRGDVQITSSSPKPVQKQAAETTYYMQNSMIGRLMNTANCSSCPKH